MIIPGTPYIVAYRVRDSEVEILFVQHGARQWPDEIYRGLNATVTEHPAYIREAFRSLDIEVHELKVTDYSPTLFGNLVCHADTGLGRLRIAYDRQFEIDVVGEQKSGDAQTISALIKALEEAKRRSGL